MLIMIRFCCLIFEFDEVFDVCGRHFVLIFVVVDLFVCYFGGSVCERD